MQQGTLLYFTNCVHYTSLSLSLSLSLSHTLPPSLFLPLSLSLYRAVLFSKLFSAVGGHAVRLGRDQRFTRTAPKHQVKNPLLYVLLHATILVVHNL